MRDGEFPCRQACPSQLSLPYFPHSGLLEFAHVAVADFSA